jgi:hypothetical protein
VLAGTVKREEQVTAREAAIFSSLVEAAVAPRAPLPGVAQTDACAAFARYLDASPAVNRAALRAALLALELGPLALRFGARLRQLPLERRVAYLERVERGRLGTVPKALRGLAQLCYYGDAEVMVSLGYDAAAVVARGRALRAAEERW